MRTLLCTNVGNLIICYYPQTGQPSDEEWDAFTTLGVSVLEKHSRLLVLSVIEKGCYPSAAQRGRQMSLLRSLKREHDVRAVVLTDSILARGAVTAYSWLGADIRAFDNSKLERAMDWLGVAPADCPACLQALKAMREETAAAQEPLAAPSSLTPPPSAAALAARRE